MDFESVANEVQLALQEDCPFERRVSILAWAGEYDELVRQLYNASDESTRSPEFWECLRCCISIAAPVALQAMAYLSKRDVWGKRSPFMELYLPLHPDSSVFELELSPFPVRRYGQFVQVSVGSGDLMTITPKCDSPDFPDYFYSLLAAVYSPNNCPSSVEVIRALDQLHKLRPTSAPDLYYRLNYEKEMFGLDHAKATLVEMSKEVRLPAVFKHEELLFIGKLSWPRIPLARTLFKKDENRRLILRIANRISREKLDPVL